MTQETWFLLFDGSSPDGRGQGVFVGRTTDKEVARRHYDKCQRDPYSVGNVRIATALCYSIASRETNWDAL